MTNKLMYFGTKERMAWVKCPAINADTPSIGWSASGTFLNGGAYVRNSTASHKEYRFVWNLASQADIDPILDYAQGLYGDDLIYFLDPFAWKSNLFPAYWAAPRLAASDAPPLVRDQIPTLTDTLSNGAGLPTKSATYTLHQGDTFLSQYFPIPSGYTLNLGVYGTSTGTAGVVVDPDGGTTTVTSRTQLVKNPNSNTTPMSNSGFGTTGAGTQVRTAGAGESSSYASVQTWTTAATGGTVISRFGGASSADDIPVVAGTTIIASVAVKSSAARSAGQGAQAYVEFFTAAGASVSTLTGTAAAFTAGQQQRLSVTGTVPATATRAVVSARMPDATGLTIGYVLTVSRPLVETGSVLGSYFDASFTDTNPDDTTSVYYVKNGTTNASTTTQVTTIVSDQQQLVLLANSSLVRTNYTISGVSGVTVRLRGTSGSVTLSGMIAQIRPTGEGVPVGMFISGKGNSGVRFKKDTIGVQSYSAPEALDYVGASATLVEVGAWE